MSAAIDNYRKTVEQPWGRMFYDLTYRQLNIPSDKKLKILDFGAGFCITAGHYAKSHEVTAVEPSEEMYSLRFSDNDYNLVPQGAEYLETLEDNSYDVVICHNVLEYVDDREALLQQFVRILKKGGMLSIVKHNDPGRVMMYAVLNDNPKAALELLTQEENENCAFGTRNVYNNENLIASVADKAELAGIYGVRTFFGLSSNNDIKFTDEWYESMLDLETEAGKKEEYKKIAFFNHLIFRKK
ncbi:Methyltransferase domain-containing protein [Butyrivibrio sp. ob235]|uniref:class I SAM-dependent methyltransferase n=1 Tax=Butyrivibrio sp. ob235 TaxID=1761780 RepID=UPI0008D867C3|nr:class I SAM-dependent methyltransferase [Butyrivibrio sp. ob235]SEK72499.1 Methyltransferase domain-containing protein [Butyrivibrio sp. ob235]